MGEVIDFNKAKGILVVNPLEAWRMDFKNELQIGGYTTSLPKMLVTGCTVDQSDNLYQLNTKIINLVPGEKLILFQNHHFELFFYYSYENILTLRIGTLLSGIDAFLLQNKFSAEKKIFDKYYGLMLDVFGKENN